MFLININLLFLGSAIADLLRLLHAMPSAHESTTKA